MHSILRFQVEGVTLIFAMVPPRPVATPACLQQHRWIVAAERAQVQPLRRAHGLGRIDLTDFLDQVVVPGERLTEFRRHVFGKRAVVF